MASVAPTINATSPEDYARRIDNVKPFATRLHIDVGDGVFTDVKTVGLSQVYDIDGVPFDLHLMMVHPEGQFENICSLQPQMVIIHFEAPINHVDFFKQLRSVEIRVGLAINVETTVEQVRDLLLHVDHLVVFTGKLGHNGGEFRADCLEKISQARAINPNLEIAVDGGINQETARQAIEAGANLLDVGSFIHDSEDPEIAYIAVQAIAEGQSLAKWGKKGYGYKNMTHKQLELQANEIRQDIIKMLVAAGSGHSAGPLGLADIFAALYFEVLVHRPKQPDWPERDRLILSNGHTVPVRYAAMARAGYFPVKELLTLRKFGSRLQGHPERLRLPGLETTSGPLGSGLSQAAGMALALRMDGSRSRVYCVTGDGELNEGNIWEGIMFAAAKKLNNLTVIVDRNNIQIDGPTERVMPLDNLAAKWATFNWHVIEIDGHNIDAIISACNLAKAVVERPTVIIAHTIPGKGVDFMEYDYHWHGYFTQTPGAPPLEDVAKVALHELRTLGGQIRSEHE